MATPQVIVTGPVTDYVGLGPDNGYGGRAVCVCVHGKRWPEGDDFEPEGEACEECSLAARAMMSAPS